METLVARTLGSAIQVLCIENGISGVMTAKHLGPALILAQKMDDEVKCLISDRAIRFEF